jgi:hypothetical protein
VEAGREQATNEHLDVNAVLAFAEHALTHAARLWEQGSPEHRRRLQAVYFPAGIAWDTTGKFQTAATSSAFKELRELVGPHGHLASPTGFEHRPPRKPSSQSVVQTHKDDGLRRGPGDGKRRK